MRSLEFGKLQARETIGIARCVSAHGSTLTSLSLALHDLDAVGAPSLPCLRTLRVTAANVRDASVAWLASLPSLTALSMGLDTGICYPIARSAQKSAKSAELTDINLLFAHREAPSPW